MNKLPEDKVLEYLEKAYDLLWELLYKNIYKEINLKDRTHQFITWHIEIAKMIQLEEHREDK